MVADNSDCGKIAYPSAAAAAQARTKMRRMYRDCSVYHCIRCGNFHIGREHGLKNRHAGHTKRNERPRRSRLRHTDGV